MSKFTDYDTQSAMDKLEVAAFKWDQTNYIEATYVNGFEAFLTPYDFKLQIDRSFGVRLTGAEVSNSTCSHWLLSYSWVICPVSSFLQLGSIIKKYSTRPGDHCIDGYLFLKHFCSLRDKKQREFEASKVRFQQKKERILNMGQHIDILPKMLGR